MNYNYLGYVCITGADGQVGTRAGLNWTDWVGLGDVVAC